MGLNDEHGIFGADRRGLALSVVFHLLLLLVGAFGLPALLPDTPEPEPLVMTVDILPISSITNVKPSDKPITDKKETPKPPKKAEPVKKAEPPKPTPPKPVEKPVEKTVEKPTEKEPEKKFDPDEGKEVVKKEPPKPAPPKPTPPAPEKTESDFDKMMKELKKTASEEATKDAKDTTDTPENKTVSQAAYDDSLPLSLSEKDAIRNQFIPCWSPPSGAKGVENLVVVLKAQYQQDGTLIDVKISPKVQGRYGSDGFYKAAADSAMRAVHLCSPLKNMDMSKYGSWKDMELTFDPRMYQ